MPRFVYRALQDSPGAPDGPVRPLLCGQCEDRFSVWESQFACEVFHPFVSGQAVHVKYGPWLLKFATSVCWRILEDARRAGRGPAEPGDCLNTWGSFLRDRRPDVGAHHLHLLREDGSLGRTVEFEVSGSDTAAWVYAKLGPLILFGLIRDGSPQSWSGTRLHREGKLKPRGWAVPAQYRQYLAGRTS